MEHPLIGPVDDLTVEQLQSKISNLSKKLTWARANNAYLAHQIEMALETFNNQYRAKQQAMYDQAAKKAQDFSNKIDIS